MMAHVKPTCAEIGELVKLFKTIRRSCLAFQNSLNGPVTISAHTSVLLKSYTTDNPLINLILRAVESHIDQFKDGGASLGLMICELLISFYKSEYHPRMYSNVLLWCSRECASALPGMSEARFEVTTECITAVIAGVLSRKLSPYMNVMEFHSLVKQLAEVFVMTEGRASAATVAYVKRGNHSNEVQVYPGMLLDVRHSPVPLTPGDYTAVLISCSLSGDTEEVMDVNYVGNSSLDLSETILSRIEALVSVFAAGKVSLLICQRVIHPKVKRLLESRGLRYLERLGTAIGRLAHMSGVSPCSSVTAGRNVVTSVGLRVKSWDNTWLLINTTGEACNVVYTVQISSWTEHIASDIEASCAQALKTLDVLLQDTKLLPDCGVWQSRLASHLERSLRAPPSEELRRAGANVSSFRCVVGDFILALEKVGGAEASIGGGTCGTLTGPSVGESLKAQLSMLTTAVSISNAVALTGQLIRLS